MMPSGICNGRTEVTETSDHIKWNPGIFGVSFEEKNSLQLPLQYTSSCRNPRNHDATPARMATGVSSTASCLHKHLYFNLCTCKSISVSFSKGKERRYSMFAMSITVLPTRNVTISDLIPTGPAQISMWSRARIW
ncbi:hypothetical protein J6590_017916 [Homalodisca vitripennis]|nr:hypothetical protein J6590_017916 [Homalodisca vitripennis]